MSEQEIRKMIDEVYDDSKEEGIRQMMKDFYNRRMRGMVILLWSMFVVIGVPAVLCAVAFFEADEVKDQILYATLFAVLMQSLGLIKVFAWQIIHRNSIKRELKRLELRIAQLSNESL